MSQKQLTETELNEIATELKSINSRQQRSELSLEDALTQARAAKKIMMDTFDRSIPKEDQDPNRLKVWDDVNGLIKTLEGEKFEEDKLKGPRVPKDGELEIADRTALQEVKRVINSMTLNGEKTLTRDEKRYFDGEYKRDRNGNPREGVVSDEQYVTIRRAMLNDYGKGIDADHVQMIKLGEQYHNKTLDNYESYAMEQMRAEASAKRPKRLAALLKKVTEGIKDSKYTNPTRAETVANILRSAMPSNDNGSDQE